MLSNIILFLALLLGASLADSDKESNIFGGKDAEEGYFPYQVGIAAKNSFICGGSLISETFVLTAAHCFNKRNAAKSYNVYLGSIKVMEGMKRVGRTLIIHPKYRTHVNDIALLEIDEVPFSDNIRSVNLPNISNSDIDYENAAAIVTGWGLIHNKNLTQTLQFTELNVASNSVCARDEIVGQFVTATNICAGDADGRSTPCKGDSGGPLVEVENLVLIGITSFGPSGINCEEQTTTAFTRVSSYRQWILDNTGV